MQEEVKRWWEKAQKDFDDARFNFNGKRYETSAFLSQQAAEKALKALLIKKTRKLKKIHDLVELGLSVGLPENLIEKAKNLPLLTYTLGILMWKRPGILKRFLGTS